MRKPSEYNLLDAIADFGIATMLSLVGFGLLLLGIAFLFCPDIRITITGVPVVLTGLLLSFMSLDLWSAAIKRKQRYDYYKKKN